MRQPGVLTLAVALLVGPAILPARPERLTSDVEIDKASEAARSHPTDGVVVPVGDAFMQKARETMDLSYYGRAEGAYRKSLASNSKSANALVGMAWVLSGRHEFEQSIDWAKKALAIDPIGPTPTVCWVTPPRDGRLRIRVRTLSEDARSSARLLLLQSGRASLFITGGFEKATLLMSKAVGAGGPFRE